MKIFNLGKTLKNREKLLKRFWPKVDIKGDDKCWNWKGFIGSNGYGLFWIKGSEMIYAHRVSYVIRKGIIPDGMLILHKCDNPSCVNPEHLYCGTQLDNMNDRDERNPNSCKFKLRELGWRF
jgi:hypothetical protein